MKHIFTGVFLLRKVCVLGTKIQFIVYNDEKAASILCIVLLVTDFITCY